MQGPVAQFRSERTPDKREVDGSSPSRPTRRELEISLGKQGLMRVDKARPMLGRARFYMSDYAQLADLRKQMVKQTKVTGRNPINYF